MGLSGGPRRKAVGDPVFAGSVNAGSVLRVRVTAAASGNTIARIVRLVEEAQESKSPTERFIDRFSKVYPPAVLVVGALVALVPPLAFGGDWGEWIYKGLAILLIGCPCALVISTPAAIAAGLSAGARRGLLMKGGAVLESLSTITAIAFDKKGTLTAGRPVVTGIVPGSRSALQVQSLAAALEKGSSHPLAMAILDRAKIDKAPIPPSFDANAVPGEGVEGKTVSIVVVAESVAGYIAMRDEARPDAMVGLTSLKASGIRTIMLTGDNRCTAEAVAADLEIEALAELLPQDKQRIVREL